MQVFTPRPDVPPPPAELESVLTRAVIGSSAANTNVNISTSFHCSVTKSKLDATFASNYISPPTPLFFIQNLNLISPSTLTPMGFFFFLLLSLSFSSGLVFRESFNYRKQSAITVV